ncbi:IclR family transcriptional regulator [Mycobacterium sp. HM-7]
MVELLAARVDTVSRLSDVVRELGLNQATAYAILSELTACGWVTRDPVDKSYALGSAVAGLGEAARRVRPLNEALRAAAVQLSHSLRYAVSVSERVDQTLVITAVVGKQDPTWSVTVGDRLPFAAPFGPAYAAWDPEPQREQWIERSGVKTPTLVRHLRDYLAEIRDRGYSVERMSEAAARVIGVMSEMHADQLSDSMRGHVSAMLTEVTTSAASKRSTGPASLVGAIGAPVFRPGGPVVASLCVHPFEDLGIRAIQRIGRSLTGVIATVTSENVDSLT